MKAADEMGDVTVDDTVLFLARFSGGAVASFEACRQATGNQNRNGFEINGTKGSFKFDFERMNELEYYDATRPAPVQGWTNIMCTHGGDHPYVGQLVARRPHHRLRARLHQPGLRHPVRDRRPDADRADPRLRRRLPDPARAGGRHALRQRKTLDQHGRREVSRGHFRVRPRRVPPALMPEIRAVFLRPAETPDSGSMATAACPSRANPRRAQAS